MTGNLGTLRNFLGSISPRIQNKVNISRFSGVLLAILDILHGDNGKAVVAAWFLKNFSDIEYVVRFQGGANAGHTVFIDGQKFVTHCIPVGVLYGKIGAIGPNCVINMPFTLNRVPPGMSMPSGISDEIINLIVRGIPVNEKNLIIDPMTAITWLPQIRIERRREGNSANKVGSTLKGIAPAYEAIAGKYRVSVGACLDEQWLKEELKRVAFEIKDHRSCVGINPLNYVKDFLAFGQYMQKHASIQRVDEWIAKMQKDGKDGILEALNYETLNQVYI